jgi:2-amino-4-hydroxy-6-hydroxymethyldihydropteridine diphosphokinase
MLSEVYLGLGSNLGDRRGNIGRAVDMLRRLSGDVTVSSLYETSPQGFSGQPWFINAACRLWTRLSPFELLACLKDIQAGLGSPRAFANGPRALDIDILLYGQRVLDTPSLTVPHPRMAQREFVLAPLAEIAPHVRHPVRNETMRSLLRGVAASSPKRLASLRATAAR